MVSSTGRDANDRRTLSTITVTPAGVYAETFSAITRIDWWIDTAHADIACATCGSEPCAGVPTWIRVHGGGGLLQAVDETGALVTGIALVKRTAGDFTLLRYTPGWRLRCPLCDTTE